MSKRSWKPTLFWILLTEAVGGLAALLSMLNSCAAGVSVVNIDNGFGAGFLASRINHIGVGESK